MSALYPHAGLSGVPGDLEVIGQRSYVPGPFLAHLSKSIFCQKWQQMDLPILAIYGNYQYWQEMNLQKTAIGVRGQI